MCLDEGRSRASLPDLDQLKTWHAHGVRIVAPPLHALLELDAEQELRALNYACDAKAAGLAIIGWSLKRSGFIANVTPGLFYQGLAPVLRREGDVLHVLDVPALDVSVLGVFSDWPATTPFSAQRKGLP